MSFFFRRRTWLEIIGRPDLLTTQTKSACHFVCSLHFDKSMIKSVPQLKTDAVPTKSLLDQVLPTSIQTKTVKMCRLKRKNHLSTFYQQLPLRVLIRSHHVYKLRQTTLAILLHKQHKSFRLIHPGNVNFELNIRRQKKKKEASA